MLREIAKTRDPDAVETKKELEEVISLTKDLIREMEGPRPRSDQPPPPPPAPAGSSNTAPPPAPTQQKQKSGIAQVANKLTAQSVTEFQGWRVGEKCRTVWLGDGKKYPALISSLKPQTKSAVVTFVKYLNQQETPIDFLERMIPDDEEDLVAPVVEAKGNKEGERKRKEMGDVNVPVILATDTAETIAKKKRLLKKLKRESKMIEKEKDLEKKTNNWKNFQQTAQKKRKAGVKESSIFKSSESSSKAVGVSEKKDKGLFQDAGVRKKWAESKNVTLPQHIPLDRNDN